MKSVFLAATLIGTAIAGLIIYYANDSRKIDSKLSQKLGRHARERALHSMG